ncbi:MAG TPA: LacI family DNA-binding transcriptional regulator [Candidatus Dormibacteraeota bacterium]|nr:LacI family DNA-binding transcriptional regulator [Candidatus Dormibacteraeota bacterium]
MRTFTSRGKRSERRQPRPTMRDVAALAHVSVTTVSRVINEEPGVSARLAVRVGAAIEQLNYRHNLTASSLRRADGRGGTIGVVLEYIADPFDALMHRAIEEYALTRGVLVLAGSLLEDEARERELIAALAARRVDGLVIMPAGHDQSYLMNERRSGTPMVFVDRPPGFFDADDVLTDNLDGSRRGVGHLLAHGHRRVGYLGDLQTITTAALRHQGYREELTAHGIGVDDRLVRTDVRGSERAEAATREILSNKPAPTALFAGQGPLTTGAYRALRSLGLHHKVALVGFDDIPLADLLEPGITVMAQDPASMGRAAAELLFRRMDGDRSPSVHQVIPTRLITRGSGEIRP